MFQQLDAQRKLADAEALYYRAQVEYELAIKNVHFEKGSILEYNGIYLSELPSPGKAYKDAYEKIKMRTRSARWAQNAANGHVVSEGLVPQAYSPDGMPTGVKGPRSGVPAAPPAEPPHESTDPAEPDAPIKPIPETPVPMPQARLGARTTSRPIPASADSAPQSGYDDLERDEVAAVIDDDEDVPMPASPADGADISEAEDLVMPADEADEIPSLDDGVAGDADEQEEIPAVEDSP